LLSNQEHQVATSVAPITTQGRAAFDVSRTGTLVYRESGSGATSQLIVMTLDGDLISTIGPPADYQTLAISPDGSQLAVEQHDLRTGQGDLWLVQVKGGGMRRLTFDGVHHNAAVWSPSNDSFVFTGRPGGVRNLHLMDVRSGAHEPLLPSGPDRNPTDWSPDGRYVLYEENGPGTRFDLWALRMPEREPIRLSSESFNERSARASPDGRFMAYVSDRTGQPEVYVRPFLDRDVADEERVSVTGGLAPRWSGDGRHLFFYGLDGSVLAVQVDTSRGFTHGRPEQHFAVTMHFACSPEQPLRCPAPPVTWEALTGGRFLINEKRTGPAASPLPIRVVKQWTASLAGGAPAP
jgi:Tol biopolymer transport system component